MQSGYKQMHAYASAKTVVKPSHVLYRQNPAPPYGLHLSSAHLQAPEGAGIPPLAQPMWQGVTEVKDWQTAPRLKCVLHEQFILFCVIDIEPVNRPVNR